MKPRQTFLMIFLSSMLNIGMMMGLLGCGEDKAEGETMLSLLLKGKRAGQYSGLS